MWVKKLDLPLNFTLLTSKHKIKTHLYLSDYSQAWLSLHPPPHISAWPTHTLLPTSQKRKSQDVKKIAMCWGRNAQNLKPPLSSTACSKLWWKPLLLPVFHQKYFVPSPSCRTHLTSCPGPLLLQKDNQDSQTQSSVSPTASVHWWNGSGLARSILMYHRRNRIKTILCQAKAV